MHALSGHFDEKEHVNLPFLTFILKWQQKFSISAKYSQKRSQRYRSNIVSPSLLGTVK